MSGIRVLVGTRKGAFVLTSDNTRRDWRVDGPHFGGWEIYHLNGSPADPNRIYASQSGGWFGQVIQRSDDGGKTWATAGNDFAYQGDVGDHLWYDGTPRPWEFKRIWHLEPSLTDPDTVYAGGEDAALYISNDAGGTWKELTALRQHKTGPTWQPGAGGLCLHTIILDRVHKDRIYVAISAAGAFRSDDGGASWLPINRGLRSGEIPDQDAETGHCVHHITQHPARPDTLYMQKHWDVMRSDDAGENWREVSGNLPSDFGFPSRCTRTSRRRSTSFRSRAIRSTSRRRASCVSTAAAPAAKSGSAHRGPAPVRLLRQRLPRRYGGGFAGPVRHLLWHHRWSGLPLGRQRRQLGPIVRDLPAVLSVEVQVLP
jgi:hypothetical protein